MRMGVNITHCVVVSTNSSATLLPVLAPAAPRNPAASAAITDRGRPVMLSMLRCRVVDTACRHSTAHQHT